MSGGIFSYTERQPPFNEAGIICIAYGKQCKTIQTQRRGVNK